MKKLPSDYFVRQRRITADRFERDHRKKKRSKRKTRNRPQRFFNYEIVTAPRELILFPEQADEVIQFIGHLNNLTNKGKKILIDFSQTSFISVLSSVYLYSEIDNILREHGKTIVKIMSTSMDSLVRSTLRDSGLFELCGNFVELRGDRLRIFRGLDDEKLSEITDYFVGTSNFDGRLNPHGQDYSEWLANKAIGEAMLNVKQHAYPEHEEENRFWWATAEIIHGTLHLALCDRGVGIPRTLSNKSWFKSILEAIKHGSDSEMIKEAMIYTRSSRPGVTGGGLGSRDIQDLILKSKDGHLTIISGKGYYRLESRIDGSTEEAIEIGRDINGTLIQWEIPLKN